MVAYDEYMQIKILHKLDKSLRAIACKIECSVNTVRKYLNEQAKPAYLERARRESMMAPFATYLQECVAAAAPDWIPATVLWREIHEQGFVGNERTVRNFAATVRPVRAPDPLDRFETAAGDKMQVDWIEFRRRKGVRAYFDRAK
jgi:transposase